MPLGRLVIEGGPKTPRHDAIYQAILKGRHGDGPLCIIPTSNHLPDSATAAEIKDFGAKGWGSAVVGIPLTVDKPEAAQDARIVAELNRCSGFFFLGGRQMRSSRVFRPDGKTTLALEAIRARYHAGAVIAGTSAGAAIMSDPMLNAGTNAASLERGVASGGITLVPGLGFFSGVLVDQHFLAVNRIARLLVTVLQVDAFDIGFGVDENTALVVEKGRAWVEGASGVVFVDGRQARRAAEGNGGSGLRVHLLGAGDTVDLTTFRP
ncbi:MAG: cyanophycinase, partial [Longimicrobiales bacterium]